MEESFVIRLVAVSFAIVLLLAALPLQAQISGVPSVTDGDTLRLGAERIRLHGIDAPESAQSCRARGKIWACGEAASRALRERIGRRPVACAEHDRDRYGRIVAVCRVAGADVNAGWSPRAGRWPTGSTRPITSRRNRPRRPPAAACGGATSSSHRAGVAGRDSRHRRRAVRAIAASGDISKKGTRIYHVPGGAWYAKTRIDTAKGERWFCTEAKARAAGWRRAKR